MTSKLLTALCAGLLAFGASDALAVNVSGAVTTTTWTKANSPYVVVSDITVSRNDTLTIEAGVDVQFSEGTSLTVTGGLRALGSESDSVRFGPGGDYTWCGIQLSDGADCRVEYGIIEGAERTGGGALIYGGGMCVNGSFALLRHTVVRNNRAWNPDGIINVVHPAYGGGIAVIGSGQLVLEECLFDGNRAESRQRPNMGGYVGSSCGGGVYVGSDASLTARGSIFRSCFAQYGGGAAFTDNGTMSFTGCLFYQNTLDRDGNWSDWIQGGSAVGQGRLGSTVESEEAVQLIGCTVTGNTVVNTFYTAVAGPLSHVSARNCIIWGNHPDQPEGSLTTPVYCNLPYTATGSGNISADPLFADTLAGDFSLSTGSPCINAGDPSSPLDTDGTRADIGANPYMVPVSVEDEAAGQPLSLSLNQNAPNPFNPSTSITFSIPVAGHAGISVYNLTGQCVAELVNGALPAGQHTVTWDGRDMVGRPAASGVYVYALRCDGQTRMTRRMVLLR